MKHGTPSNSPSSLISISRRRFTCRANCRAFPPFNWKSVPLIGSLGMCPHDTHAYRVTHAHACKLHMHTGCLQPRVHIIATNLDSYTPPVAAALRGEVVGWLCIFSYIKKDRYFRWAGLSYVLCERNLLRTTYILGEDMFRKWCGEVERNVFERVNVFFVKIKPRNRVFVSVNWSCCSSCHESIIGKQVERRYFLFKKKGVFAL